MFWFRLAAQLGMSVARTKREISSPEFVRWQAYYELEPFGEERADLRAGIVASTIVNVQRGKGQRAVKATDFMPEFGKKAKQKMTRKQMAFKADQYRQRYEAFLKRKGNGRSS